MKTMKYLSMMLVILAMSVCMASCGDDDNESGNILAGTRWAYSDVYEDGTSEVSLTFNADNTAVWNYVIRNAGGTIVTNETAGYNYQISEDLVVMTAQQAGKANLEGTISSGVKMEVKNMSTQKSVGTFYKK